MAEKQKQKQNASTGECKEAEMSRVSGDSPWIRTSYKPPIPPKPSSQTVLNTQKNSIPIHKQSGKNFIPTHKQSAKNSIPTHKQSAKATHKPILKTNKCTDRTSPRVANGVHFQKQSQAKASYYESIPSDEY